MFLTFVIACGISVLSLLVFILIGVIAIGWSMGPEDSSEGPEYIQETLQFPDEEI